MQTEKGQSIEDASMAVIEKEIGEHQYDQMQWPIVRRVIHSTADFAFAIVNAPTAFAGKQAIKFSPDSIKNGINALKQGCCIVTDVHGVSGLLSKAESAYFKNRIICKISDPDVTESAKNAQTTRAQASMRACAEELNGGIVAIGNAPTALLEIIKMSKGVGIQDKMDGFIEYESLASYGHLYFNSKMAKNIIDVAVASSRR